jgi:hypothetical protein
VIGWPRIKRSLHSHVRKVRYYIAFNKKCYQDVILARYGKCFKQNY